MKTIDRYILTKFFQIFFLTMVTLISFYIMIIYRDYLVHFVKFEATTDMVVRYLLFKIPIALFHVTPICVLMATLLTAVSLSRYSEMIAMGAAGISVFRIAAPILIVSAGISVLAHLNSEYLFSKASREAKRIYREEIKKQDRKSLFAKDGFWYRTDNGAIWNIGHVSSEKRTVEDVSIFYYDKSGENIIRRVTAKGGALRDGLWVFEEYVERIFDDNGSFTESRLNRKSIPSESFSEEDFDKVKLDPEEMNLARISEYINDLKAKGYEVTQHIVDKHGKIAFPLISLVMPLIAFPMGVRSSRNGGVLVGVGVALIIGSVFWFLFSMGLALGKAERLPPMLAAYGAHAFFAAIGVYMTAQRR